ncbi:PEGA domain-containing protein [Albimonas pacifica]|uniref:PEGA domain-containing protein n=1 Tax=Albimonas pacifica TaxID=1114924 RepID=A0A1I3LQ05_9RHOB|nr:PEGA domain-containing protein [Albimonas pacifica]SFI86630.1 PEGA domain-containing protein [Albimonas pacifica]
MLVARLVAALALAALAGCATITHGSTDTVSIDTRPSGASCTVTQGGAQVARVDPTPGTIMVPKSKHDLAVRCEKEGYQPAVGSVGSEFQAMTFGNIVFGGVIGVAVDAASGAMNDYEPMVTIALLPDRFESQGERDRFFDKLRDDYMAEAADTIARIKAACTAGDECTRQVEIAEQRRTERLVDIEAKRQQARVAG